MKNVTIMRNMKYGFEENIDEDDRNPDWEKAFEHRPGRQDTRDERTSTGRSRCIYEYVRPTQELPVLSKSA